MAIITSFLLILLTVHVSTIWITPSSPLLPRGDSGMAIGYYNRSIFIIGGRMNPNQLTEYDILNDTMIDYGPSVISSTYGIGQFYTQINHIVYMIDPNGYQISIFNTILKTFTPSWNNVNIPQNTGQYGCLSSVIIQRQSYLVVVGGDPSNSALQILSTDSLTWLQNMPSMNTARVDLTCIIHPTLHTLYAIGGMNSTSSNAISLNTVEQIYIGNISNIHNENWKYIQNLSPPTSCSRAIIYGLNVYIVGGYYNSSRSGGYLNNVEIINCVNDTITSGVSMNFATSSPGVIIANDIIYSFGGFETNNRWQYFVFPPTNTTTNTPTNNNEFGWCSLHKSRAAIEMNKYECDETIGLALFLIVVICLIIFILCKKKKETQNNAQNAGSSLIQHSPKNNSNNELIIEHETDNNIPQTVSSNQHGDNDNYE